MRSILKKSTPGQDAKYTTAVILNDTRGDAHFGCMRVMSCIESQLAQRGVSIIATSVVRNNWQRDVNFLNALAACDLIVINGEGTLHHGAHHGERLLEVACHPASRGKKIALINALYQENPSHWNKYLERFDLLSARDEVSRQELEVASGKRVLFCPDLSLVEERPNSYVNNDARMLLTVGDSVLKDARSALYKYAHIAPDAKILSIQSQLKSPKAHLSPFLRGVRKIYTDLYDKIFSIFDGKLIIPKNHDEFMGFLERSSLHVTGRFHGVCLCLVTGTPFLALRSNSRKVEAILDLFALKHERLIDKDDLKFIADRRVDFSFTKEELRNIESGLLAARSSAEAMFDRMVYDR